ncbi:MAG: class I SAM-dependent methyltransferase [Proteobacteria bacterium]|nr:class I SAM-dependent methyltransferase [Pseudomonadota bacterium]
MQGSEQYNPIALQYSELFADENQLSISAYFKHINYPLSGKKVLDLGCGDGYDLSLLAKCSASLHGVDASEEMLRLAKQKNPQAEFKHGYFERIPYADHTFDVVLSKWAIQTSANIAPIYQEVHRVLKPQGVFQFLVSHPIRTFLEKKKHPKDYFKQEMVDSHIFKGQIVVRDPSHTMNEFLSPFFLQHFDLIAYEEGFDAGAEKVDGDTYPIFFIIKAIKRS